MTEQLNNWTAAPLKDLTSKVGSGATPRGGGESYKTSGTPLIRSMNVIMFGFKRDGLAFIDDTQSRALQGVEVHAGDVLLNITGASIGRVTLTPADLEGARVNQHVCIIRPTVALDSRYLAAYLSSPKMQAEIGADHYGMTRPALTKQQILEFEIPLPPRPEQTRIADKLDSLIAQIKRCHKRLDRVPQILKKFREAVIEAAVSGKLTEEWRAQQPRGSIDAKPHVEVILNAHVTAGGHRAGNAAPPTSDVHDLDASMFPKEWGLIDLREAIEPGRPITYGILKPGPEVSDGVSYVRVADYPGNRLNLETVRKTSKSIESEFARARLRAGDLLLSIRGTVGRLIVIPGELEGANITQDSARLSIQGRLNRDFVRLYLTAPMAQQRMRRATKGVAVRGINIGDVRALQLPIPSLAEQGEISRRVEDLFHLANSLDRRHQEAVSMVEKLTPSVLAKAFRGELVPQDPNDEPAGEMLRRVRAAGSANQTAAVDAIDIRTGASSERLATQ